MFSLSAKTNMVEKDVLSVKRIWFLLSIGLVFNSVDLIRCSTIHSKNSLITGNVSQVLKNVKQLPKGDHNQPFAVKLGLYFESIGNFLASQMTYDLDAYLYLSWRDPTLSHNGTSPILINDEQSRKDIWLPDIYFANAKTASFQSVTVPNFSIFISSDGTISYSSRVTMTVTCNYDLKSYPMDSQNCYLEIQSYAYVARVVNVSWFRSNPIRYNPHISLPEFSIISIDPEYCSGSYIYALTDNGHQKDDFSCLKSVIRLKRNLGYSIVQWYIPTTMIVVISWVSFWIDRRASPARVTLSFTTLLTLTTLGNGMRFGLPQVSYAKSIDIWFGACMFFVFCNLIEFAVVNSYMRKSDKDDKLSQRFLPEDETALRKATVLTLPTEDIKMLAKRLESIETAKNRKVTSRIQILEDAEGENAIQGEERNSVRDSVLFKLARRDSSERDSPIIQPNATIAEHYAELSLKHSRLALHIDKSCRFVFPVGFLLWNIAYWSYYCIL